MAESTAGLTVSTIEAMKVMAADPLKSTAIVQVRQFFEHYLLYKKDIHSVHMTWLHSSKNTKIQFQYNIVVQKVESYQFMFDDNFRMIPV